MSILANLDTHQDIFVVVKTQHFADIQQNGYIVRLAPVQGYIFGDSATLWVIDVKDALIPITCSAADIDFEGAHLVLCYRSRRVIVISVRGCAFVGRIAEERFVIGNLLGRCARVHGQVHDELVLNAGGFDGLGHADLASVFAVVRCDEAVLAQVGVGDPLARLVGGIVLAADDLPGVVAFAVGGDGVPLSGEGEGDGRAQEHGERDSQLAV